MSGSSSSPPPSHSLCSGCCSSGNAMVLGGEGGLSFATAACCGQSRARVLAWTLGRHPIDTTPTQMLNLSQDCSSPARDWILPVASSAVDTYEMKQKVLSGQAAQGAWRGRVATTKSTERATSTGAVGRQRRKVRNDWLRRLLCSGGHSERGRWR